MKAILGLVAAFMLASCATADRKSDADIVTDLGVRDSAIVAQYRCFHSIAPKGARAAAWEESMCIRTKDRIVFGRFDKDSGRYVQGAALPFSTVRSVNLYKRGLARQIQLETDAGVHAIAVKPTVAWTAADNAATEAEHAALANAGIPAGAAATYISRSNSTAFIPVFIPGR